MLPYYFHICILLDLNQRRGNNFKMYPFKCCADLRNQIMFFLSDSLPSFCAIILTPHTTHSANLKGSVIDQSYLSGTNFSKA